MKTFSKIKVFFSTFTIRLLIWFWLITLVSIIGTRFVIDQLSIEALNRVIHQQASDKEIKLLHNITKRIKKNTFNSIAEFKKFSRKYTKQQDLNIWLKPLNSTAEVQSLFPMPPPPHQSMRRFINQQTFTQLQSYVFPHGRLIGPQVITLRNKSYQLFISKKYRHRNFGQIVQGLPLWIRFTIPVLISLIFCFLLARSLSKPIRAMKKATAKIGRGNFSTRIAINGNKQDELSQLAQSFNQMAEQLQRNQGAQQRLLGDVSHELRSPLTRLQMALGLIQQESSNESSREKYLKRCQTEVDRLEQMIADVLSLSRLENTLQTLKKEKICINTLLEHLIADEQFVADDKKITISLQCETDVMLVGDPILLGSAINNVLSNAVKYSPENSNVSVQVQNNNEHLILTIDDQGHGVPEQAISQLFTPFYRVNLARDRNTGGTGLGLAIAKQAIQAHNGSINAHNIYNKKEEMKDKNNNAIQGLSVIIKIPCM